MEGNTGISEAKIRRFLTAIGYPTEEIPSVVASSFFTADGLRYRVVADGDVLRLEFPLGAVNDEILLRFGGFAAGRIPRDDAVLAWDPTSDSLLLWQRVARTDDEGAMRRTFESFALSVEWWRDRLESQQPAETLPETVIRP